VSARSSEWTAKVRLKYQLHNRGDHYEVELRALPKANGIAIRYTTDGSAPTTVGAATYEGVFRVPVGSRVVCAIAVASAFGINSEILRIQIPQPGKEGPKLDPKAPARWNQRIKLDDSGAVWDFVQRLDELATVVAYRPAAHGREWRRPAARRIFGRNLDAGYTAVSMKTAADKLQDIVGPERCE
jgi:hypothetical protein